MEFGQTPIEPVKIPSKSRDELPPTLAGLQWVYAHPELNELVFTLLEEKVVGHKQDTGRPANGRATSEKKFHVQLTVKKKALWLNLGQSGGTFFSGS